MKPILPSSSISALLSLSPSGQPEKYNDSCNDNDDDGGGDQHAEHTTLAFLSALLSEPAVSIGWCTLVNSPSPSKVSWWRILHFAMNRSVRWHVLLGQYLLFLDVKSTCALQTWISTLRGRYSWYLCHMHCGREPLPELRIANQSHAGIHGDWSGEVYFRKRRRSWWTMGVSSWLLHFGCLDLFWFGREDIAASVIRYGRTDRLWCRCGTEWVILTDRVVGWGFRFCVRAYDVLCDNETIDNVPAAEIDIVQNLLANSSCLL